MATKTLNTRIELKRDTLANWQNSTLNLLSGEIAISYESNNRIGIKVGVGNKTWSQLEYAVKPEYLSTDFQISGAINDAVTSAKAYTDAQASSLTLSIENLQINKQDTIVWNSYYDPLTNKAATIADISAMIDTAMHFRGVVTAVTNGDDEHDPSTTPAIADLINGDVVLNTTNHKEYVLYQKIWYELGDESAVADLETKVTDISADIYTADTGLSAKVGTISSNLGTVSTDLGTVSTNLGTVSTNLGNLSVDIYTVNTGLSAKTEAIRDDLDELSGKFENITIDTDHLEQGTTYEWCLDAGDSFLSSTAPA